MFNYGKASPKLFGVPWTKSVHGWSKTHKSKPDYMSKSKSKSNVEYNYRSNYRGTCLVLHGRIPFADKSKSNHKSIFIDMIFINKKRK